MCCAAHAAVAAAAKVNDFCEAAGPVGTLLPIDVASNIGSSANSLPGAFRALHNSPGASIEHIFTRARNCPTQAVCITLPHPQWTAHLNRPCTTRSWTQRLGMFAARDGTLGLVHMQPDIANTLRLR